MDNESDPSSAESSHSHSQKSPRKHPKPRKTILKSKRTTTAPSSSTRKPHRHIQLNRQARHAKRKLLEHTWLNPYWRRKWRKRWGKNTWKPELKEKWQTTPEWRAKWMCLLRNNWWDITWRRRWQCTFLHEKYLHHYSHERNRKRKFWKKRWRKGGCKRMGLTFNEFLTTQRRFRALVHVPKHVANVKRRRRRIRREYQQLKEKVQKAEAKMDELFKQDKRQSLYRRVSLEFKKKIVKLEQASNIYVTKFRPAVIQFKFYSFNACQGLLCFLRIIYLFNTHATYIPPSFSLKGLFPLLLYPSVMDFFGSIFGMIGSAYFSKLYKRRTRSTPSAKQKCFDWITRNNNPPPGENKISPEQPDNPTTDLPRKSLLLKSLPRHLETKSAETPKTLSNISDDEDNKCKCTGLQWLNCCALRFCFKPGKTIRLVNRMGCLSYLLLQTAWLFNICSTGYYNYISITTPDYSKAIEKCGIFPKERHCYEFENLIYSATLTILTSFSLRSIFMFIIGMCVSERYMKRCQVVHDAFQELPSTCSDTDIEYKKVPRQILYPYLLTEKLGQYPYTLPESSRRLDKLTRGNLKKSITENLQLPLRKQRKHNKRRILSAKEKQASKTMQGFNRMRKCTIPLAKGRRYPFRLPPMDKTTTDRVQLPPELMTHDARAWLSEEDTTTSSDGHGHKIFKPHKRGLVRKRKKPATEVCSLIYLHQKDSQEVLLENAKNRELSDRVSTDESWSASTSSIFSIVSDRASEAKDDDSKYSDDFYMTLMEHSDGDDTEHSDDKHSRHSRHSRHSLHSKSSAHSINLK